MINKKVFAFLLSISMLFISSGCGTRNEYSTRHNNLVFDTIDSLKQWTINREHENDPVIDNNIYYKFITEKNELLMPVPKNRVVKFLSGRLHYSTTTMVQYQFSVPNNEDIKIYIGYIEKEQQNLDVEELYEFNTHIFHFPTPYYNIKAEKAVINGVPTKYIYYDSTTRTDDKANYYNGAAFIVNGEWLVNISQPTKKSKPFDKKILELIEYEIETFDFK